MAELNFECKKCGGIFDCNVGEIIFPPDGRRPKYENEILCPECGVLSMDDVLLTEWGQTQLTEVHLSTII